eukprot:scaffold4768_cov412-Prasinococcus_capsulatus_cf.AAC.5
MRPRAPRASWGTRAWTSSSRARASSSTKGRAARDGPRTARRRAPCARAGNARLRRWRDLHEQQCAD